jgi:MraZ protein
VQSWLGPTQNSLLGTRRTKLAQLADAALAGLPSAVLDGGWDTTCYGAAIARVDEKGRLKIPSAFLQHLNESDSKQLFVTSHNGQFVRVYPLEEWSRIEDRLSQVSSTNRVKKKFLNLVNYYGQVVSVDKQGRVLIPALLRDSAAMLVNYYGQVVSVDKQGRVLIPALLRDSAAMRGEVTVLGSLTYMDVWNRQRFIEDLRRNPLTPDDENILDELGV